MNEISKIEEYFGCVLPETYRDFLSSLKEERTGNVYLYLPEILIERNECYETKQYAPGYINIGDDGGGTAFILKLKDRDPEVSAVGHGSMDPALKEHVCASFSGWVSSGFQYEY